MLAAFAERHGITFPLLSDEGSGVIERLGLLNRHVAEQQAYYGMPVADRHRGIPYPGTFVLDEHGAVIDKQFEQSYRHRPPAALIRQHAQGSREDAAIGAVQAASEELQATAWLDSDVFRPYQRLRLHLLLRVAPSTLGQAD